jgi:hypothetical protein
MDINIRDEDNETPLFVVETVEAAQVLVEELGANVLIKNAEGETAEEKLLAEGEHPTIAAYMKEARLQGGQSQSHEQSGYGPQPAPNGLFNDNLHHPPPLPPNVTVNLGTMEEHNPAEGSTQADPDFRKRIEELAAREDYEGAEGQRQLRDLISDAVKGVSADANERDVRRRLQ